jgi:hypothetical protein
LYDVVQLAGGKLPNRLRHSSGADDRVLRNRDLKRDIEHRVRDGLHYEPDRMSDELLPTILPNWKINAPPSVSCGMQRHSSCRAAVPAWCNRTPSSTDRASSHSDANIYGQDAVFAETGHDTGREIRTNAEVASIGNAISPAIATWLGHASPQVIEVFLRCRVRRGF